MNCIDSHHSLRNCATNSSEYMTSVDSKFNRQTAYKRGSVMSIPQHPTNCGRPSERRRRGMGDCKYEKWNEFHKEESKQLLKTKLQKGG